MSTLEGPRSPDANTTHGFRSSRRQSSFSDVAKTAMRMNATAPSGLDTVPMSPSHLASLSSSNETRSESSHTAMGPPPKPATSKHDAKHRESSLPSSPQSLAAGPPGFALNDTPLSTAPSSPNIRPRPTISSQMSGTPGSGTSTPGGKHRATTLDIPGLTRSKISPDGRIAQRDIGAKLVIVMVGLPARGKSYIVKKIARYLNWLQHPTEVFNVGSRRRVAAGGGQTVKEISIEGRLRESVRRMSLTTTTSTGLIEQKDMLPGPAIATHVLSHTGAPAPKEDKDHRAAGSQDNALSPVKSHPMPAPEQMDQSASFFDPANAKAVQIREQLAIDTLDELLDYILNRNGSVGILDATNSTLERRKAIMKHLREKAPNELNVLFLESMCLDENLLQANMRLKLSGPDYKDKNPVQALEDFKKRVANYEKSYIPLGDYEEKNDISYVKMIDVGRKVVSHQIRGFLSLQLVTFLMNFNLAPRQIWLTRHGQSVDNTNGKLGGDSSLTEKGRRYAKCLTKFITAERAAWEQQYRDKVNAARLPPKAGDESPPNPEPTYQMEQEERNFCVWTSMLKRSIETAQYFNDDEFENKQMKMLDELNAGRFEGMTYHDIRTNFKAEFELRRRDKLHYRYPGPGGEGYLDVINRLQKVIVEIERMTDHVLIVGHRSVTRVLLAYFKGLNREDVAELDVPLGVLYMLEPKPYGVDFKAYRWNEENDWFDYEPDFEMRRASNPYAE